MIRVGIGGWVYPPWRGVFYPPGLVQSGELAYASRHVTSIEINGTFYGAQKPASFRRWHAEAPDGFVFAVKGPRFVTHRRDLAAAGPALDRFFASGVLELGAKLGPILWQFPPTLRFGEGAFAAFCELLPGTLDSRTIRHVVEVRHPSFVAPEFIALLRRYRIAAAFVDSDGAPAFDEVTGDFVYARLRRSVADEATGYAPAAFDGWVRRCRMWAAGDVPEDAVRAAAAPPVSGPERDCFVYFINGAKIRAPAAAQALIRRLAP